MNPPNVGTEDGSRSTPASEWTLIVGASLAGVAVAEELRTAGYEGGITLIGDEDEMPYDRPPLSKQWLLAPASDPVTPQPLKQPDWYRDNGVKLVLGAQALGLDSHEGSLKVHLSGWRSMSPTRVVIACGARPRDLTAASAATRRVCGDAPAPPLNYLRTLDDARRLRSELLYRKGRLVVVGAGFIGLEAATAAHKLGWEVEVLERSDSPLSRVLPPDVASACLQAQPRDGVEIRCGVGVASYHASDSRHVLVLESGEEVTGDVVVVGIGTIPNTDWLQASGVALDNGVVCDNQGRTTVENVWAAGDVARWTDRDGVLQSRNEQWQSAREQARTVARSITGHNPTWNAIPYFWSEIFGVRIQMCGLADPSMNTIAVRDGVKQLLMLIDEDQHLAAAVALNSPRWMGIAKNWLANRVTVAECQSYAAQLSPQATVAS